MAGTLHGPSPGEEKMEAIVRCLVSVFAASLAIACVCQANAADNRPDLLATMMHITQNDNIFFPERIGGALNVRFDRLDVIDPNFDTNRTDWKSKCNTDGTALLRFSAAQYMPQQLTWTLDSASFFAKTDSSSQAPNDRISFIYGIYDIMDCSHPGIHKTRAFMDFDNIDVQVCVNHKDTEAAFPFEVPRGPISMYWNPSNTYYHRHFRGIKSGVTSLIDYEENIATGCLGSFHIEVTR